MKEIPLSQGYVAKVDDEDYEVLIAHTWRVHRHKGTALVYAVRGTYPHVVAMHRAVLDAPPSRNVDHRDGDGLNNTKENLRLCTHAQNMRNRQKRKAGRSKYKGVYPEVSGGREKWRARIYTDGRVRKSPYFDTDEQAARQYDEWAKRYHGEFARLNFA